MPSLWEVLQMEKLEIAQWPVKLAAEIYWQEKWVWGRFWLRLQVLWSYQEDFIAHGSGEIELSHRWAVYGEVEGSGLLS